METPEYLTLRNDQKVRIELNMNSIGSFTALTGKEFFELAEGPKDVNSIRTLAWCAVVEGEACEGSELKMTELEFGRQMGLKQMKDFFQIFGRLVSSSVEKKSEQLEQDPSRPENS